CCSASSLTHRSSISSSSWSIARSSSNTCRASAPSPVSSARTALSRTASTLPPMRRRRCFISSSSRSKCLSIGSPFLSEPTRDVLFRHLSPRAREQPLGDIILDHLPREHERRVLRDARGLLHVVRHDDERVLRFQLHDQLLDPCGRRRVE